MTTYVTCKSLASTLASLAAAIGFAVPAVVAGAPPAQAAVKCATAVGQGRDFYHGPKSSNFYDTKFSNGPGLSPTLLKTHVPQGLGTWPNYFSKGHDLLVYTAYHKKKGHAYVQGIDPRTGRLTAVAEIASTHASGIAIHGKWAFISGKRGADGTYSIRKYRLSDLRAALQGRTKYVKGVGTPRKVYGSSFLAVYGNTLYAGRFNAAQRDKMYRYQIAANGTLKTLPGAVQVPKKTQGLVVTSDRYVFSTSYGRDQRGNIYVTRKGQANLDNARPRCFRSPSMSEGMTRSGGRVHLLFESGASKFANNEDGKGKPRNIIRNLHQVPAQTLLSY